MSEVTKGVKYLKINRLDADGEDYGSRIQNADNIRINFNDAGPVQYNILTVQQQSDYYLLGVINQPITSSNPGRFGFSLYASRSYNLASPSTAPNWTLGTFYTDYFFGMGSIGTATGDATDFYNSGNATSRSSSYEFRRTANEKIFLDFTCSINNPTLNPSDLEVKLIIDNNLNQTIFTTNLFTITCSPTTTTTEGIIYEIPEQYRAQGYKMSIFGESDAIAPLTASFAKFNILASPISIPSSSLLNISPDITNFANSDDNAIFNNVDIPQYSSIYQDIDYSTGLIPTNFNLLISGNASYAFVQDSNYTATGWINSRYNGSRASSIDFNT